MVEMGLEEEERERVGATEWNRLERVKCGWANCEKQENKER